MAKKAWKTLAGMALWVMTGTALLVGGWHYHWAFSLLGFVFLLAFIWSRR